MRRIRVNTTVSFHLLEEARRRHPGMADTTLIEQALTYFVARERAAEINAGYLAYDQHPPDAPDEWGTLADLRPAAR